ncbi:MAG: hypothetical protein AAF387_20765, partial [Pseudomonadota bacterium]
HNNRFARDTSVLTFATVGREQQTKPVATSYCHSSECEINSGGSGLFMVRHVDINFVHRIRY